VVEVLHFVGAQDHFIAQQFERRFLAIGLKGALTGVITAAITLFLLSLFFSMNRASAVADQMEALFGSFTISIFGWGGLLGIILLLSFLVAFTSRYTVLQSLKNIE
jgi:cell division transport system permease protein